MFVVDADVLATVQRARQVEAVVALGTLPVIVTDIVWGELTTDTLAAGAKPETVAEMEGLLKTIAGKPHVLEPGSDVARTFAGLQAAPPSEGVGEHSVIAVAVHHPDHTAVLLDRRALYRGVEELKGRVLSLHGFLDHLLSKHGLPRGIAKAISDSYCKRSPPARPPLWW